MKNLFKAIFILTVCFLFNISVASANITDYIPHKMTVQFEQDFSTNNPSETFSVIITDDYNFPNTKPIEKGTQLFLELTKVSKEKRAKMNASVKARIVKAYIPSQDTIIEIDNPNAIVKFSKYEKLDVTDKALDVGIGVANHFVKNLTYPAQFVKGVAQNKEGNRLKSGLKQTYKSSPLSYVEKGEALTLNAGELATLTFYSKIKKDNSDNSDDE